MKILVSQPKLERNLEQLQAEFMMYPDITAAVFPEGYLHTNLSLACELAARTRTLVISGSKNPKDRAVIINREGEIVMDRAKYSGYESVKEEGLLITPILCDELVLREVEEANSPGPICLFSRSASACSVKSSSMNGLQKRKKSPPGIMPWSSGRVMRTDPFAAAKFHCLSRIG